MRKKPQKITRKVRDQIVRFGTYAICIRSNAAQIEEGLDIEGLLLKTVTVTIRNPQKSTPTSASRQQKHRQKMRSLNLALVQVWVPQDRILELRSIAARMQEEGSQDLEPSAKQLAFAQFLCDVKGLTLTQEHLKSSKKLSQWLNENRKKPDRRGSYS
jgi:hypothetical protein